MFHLQTRVHFHEVVVVVLVEQAFDGAGVEVVDGLRCFDGHVAHAGAQLWVESDGGAFLDELLAAALQAAFAFAEVDDVAVVIAEQLKLDVAGGFDETFEVDASVAE